MTTVTVHKATTELSKLIERAERGEEVIIARGKTPVARLVPYAPEQPQRGFGFDEGPCLDRAGVPGAVARGGVEALGRRLIPASAARQPRLPMVA